jgi:hypothetical protein
MLKLNLQHCQGSMCVLLLDDGDGIGDGSDQCQAKMRLQSLTSDLRGLLARGIENWALPGNLKVTIDVSSDGGRDGLR